MGPALRVVLDTNILVRGMIYEGSPSGKILDACERRIFVALLSKPVLAEYRGILGQAELVERYPRLEINRVKAVLERLTYVADLVRTSAKQIEFPRDPKDAKLLALSVAGRATHLITTDRDLLDLSAAWDSTAKQLRRYSPELVIVRPDVFIERFEALHG